MSYSPEEGALVAFGFDPEEPQQQEWIEALNLEPYRHYTIDEVHRSLTQILAKGNLDASARAVRAFETFRVFLIRWLEERLEHMNLMAEEHGENAVFAVEADWDGNLYNFAVLPDREESV